MIKLDPFLFSKWTGCTINQKNDGFKCGQQETRRSGYVPFTALPITSGIGEATFCAVVPNYKKASIRFQSTGEEEFRCGDISLSLTK